MSTPLRGPELGYGSPLWDQEWNRFLAERQQLFKDIMGRLQLTDTLVSGGVLPNDPASQSVADIAMGEVSAERFQQEAGGYSSWNDLVGAARFYGIPNAEKIPPQDLLRLVQDYRLRFDGDKEDSSYVQSIAGALLTGPTQTVVKLAQRLPFVGDYLARTKVVQESDRFLSMVNEGLTADLPGNEQAGFNVAKGIFGMVGYAFPAAAAWRIAGIAGTIPSVASMGTRLPAFARAGIQGATATALLEGGGDSPILPSSELIQRALDGDRDAWMETLLGTRAGIVGVGAAFGMAQYALPHLMRKVQRSFPSRVIEPDPIPTGAADPVVDADFVFEDEMLLGPGQRRLTGPPEAPPAASVSLEAWWPSRNYSNPNAVVLRDPALPRTQPTAWVRNEAVHGQGQPYAALPSGAAASVPPPAAPFAPTAAGAGPTAVGFERGMVAPEGSAVERFMSGMAGPERPVVAAVKLPDGTVLRGQNHGEALMLGEQQGIAPELLDQGIDFFETNLGRLVSPQEAEIMRVAATKPTLRPSAAAEEAITLSHHTTIMESPAVAQMARQPQFDHADVAEAALQARPGQIAVLRNVGDVAKTVGQLTRRAAEKQLSPSQFRVVEIDIPQERVIAPAMRVGDKIFAGEPGESHGDVYNRYGIESGASSGFVTSEGRFLNRDQASAFVQSYPEALNYPPSIFTLKSGREIPETLHAAMLRPLPARKRFDILVSDGIPITNKRVEQYKAAGFFEGQRVTTAYGWEVVVKNPKADLVEVYSPYSGSSYIIETSDLQFGEGTFAPGEVLGADADAVYGDVQQFVLSRINEELASAGLPAADWLDDRTSSQLARYIEEYLDSKAIQNPVMRSAVSNYVDVKRLQDFKALAEPEDLARLQTQQAELQQAIIENAGIHEPFVDEVAAAKGFEFHADVGQESGLLIDRLSDLVVPVESEEAAMQFLRNFNREMPDLSPNTAVPMEILDAGPSSIGTSLDNNLGYATVEDALESAYNTMDELRHLLSQEPPAGGGWAGDSSSGMRGPPRMLPPTGGAGGGAGGGAFGGPPAVPSKTTFARQVAALAASGRGGLMKLQEAARLRDGFLPYFIHPERTMAVKMENFWQSVGVTEGRTYKWYQQISTGMNDKHNAANPFLEEASEIVSKFRRPIRRKMVARIEQIVDPVKRAQAMSRVGYTPYERAAQAFVRPYFNSLVGTPDAGDRIFQYLSEGRARMLRGATDPYSDVTGTLAGSAVANFENFARQRSMDFRRIDVGVLMADYTNAVMFQRHVEPVWKEMYDAVMERGSSGFLVPEDIRAPMHEWLDLVKYGPDLRKDRLVNIVRSVINVLDSSISNGDISRMTRGAITQSYRGMLGFRPDVVLRDLINPMLGWARTGETGAWAKAYKDYISGGKATRDAMKQRALQGGWLVEGMVQVPTADIVGKPEFGPYGPIARQGPIKSTLNAVADAAYQAVPERFRQGIQGTAADPLKVYTIEGEFNRIVSGEAGYNMTWPIVADVASGRMSVADALSQGPIRIWPAPVQRNFEDLLNSGRYDDAVNLIANEIANSQMRYGTIESPAGLRSTTGRLATQLGTFAQQYLAYTVEGLKSGLVRDRVGFGLRQAAITAALAKVSYETGWNFYKWMWPGSLTFVGSPIAEFAVNTWQAAFGASAEVDPSREPTYQQKGAMASWDPAGTLGGYVNPYAGGMRTVSKLYTQAQIADQPESFLRTLITGEAGLRPELRTMLRDWSPEIGTGVNVQQPLTPAQQLIVQQAGKGAQQ
jgi:hypothetical protein